MKSLSLTGRLLHGEGVRGKLLVIPHSVSFYGELEEGVPSDTILLVESTRGSTVAPYVMYRLARRNRAPRAILVWKTAEPMIVAGAVIAGVTLVDRVGEHSSINIGEFRALEGCEASVEPLGGKKARIAIRCI